MVAVVRWRRIWPAARVRRLGTALVVVGIALPAIVFVGRSWLGAYRAETSYRPEMVIVPTGTFWMGSPEDESGRDDDERRHEVTLTRRFAIARTEVTQGQWRALMGDSPSRFGACGDDCPVEQVSWFDAVAYLNALSAREKLTPCYVDEQDRTPYDAKDAKADKAAKWLGLECEGYRLPTEAEWEYAARAGTQGAVYEGEWRVVGVHNAPALDPIAWYGGNSGVEYQGYDECSGWPERQYPAETCGTHPVRGKKANPWGLYDMIGNVWEWTQDWNAAYADGAAIDPIGPVDGDRRALRGCAWLSNARFCRTAHRFARHPGARDGGVGLRPARSNP